MSDQRLNQPQNGLPTCSHDVIYAYHYKWLCAPKGSGFLYARPEVQSRLEPLVISWGWESEKPDPSRFIDHHEWWGTRDIAAFLSVPTAITFQKDNNWDGVRADCHVLAKEAEMRICELTGLPSQYSDDSWYAQMITALLPPETDILKLKKYLYNKQRIEVPLIDWNGKKLIRVSVQGYNRTKDIDALIKSLKRWMSC